MTPRPTHASAAPYKSIVRDLFSDFALKMVQLSRFAGFSPCITPPYNMAKLRAVCYTLSHE